MSTTALTTARRRTVSIVVALALAGGLVGILRPARADQPTGDAVALVETAPVASAGVAATDVAIWVNPVDATKSVIYGTDKIKGSINAYDLTGTELQSITAEFKIHEVDLRPGFPMSTGTMDVLTAAGAGSMRFYAINPANGSLTDVSAQAIVPSTLTGAGGSFDGVCMYHSATTGKFYAFVNTDSGQVQQWELFESLTVPGKMDAKLVRGGSTPANVWDVNGTTPNSPLGGCVADDDTKSLYIAEQDAALWKYAAEFDGSIIDRTSVDVPVTATPPGHFTPNLTGLAIVPTGTGTGYLIASSEGTESFMVYKRDGANEFVREFRVNSSPAIDNCDNTVGIDAAVANFGTEFPSGIFVCMDHRNTPTTPPVNQNFKYASLAAIVDMTPPVPVTPTTIEAPTTTTTAPATTGPKARSGYWMVGSDGKVYPFGDSKTFGNAVVSSGAEAVDLEPTPSGNGYWIVDSSGNVFAMGDAGWIGNASPAGLDSGEKITSISSTLSGKGYWVFTTKGRVIAFGDATHYGDMSKTKLNGPVLDSIPTASGKGYYMVASDGGIFSFGDAKFLGSMGDKKLNAPVQSLVPDGDNVGYWLVASDGGIFAFEAAFKGSMGSTKLNKPVTGMVRFGSGYLMVAEDGGIFNFSDKPFHGSLGATPPARPVVSVAVLG
jgi:myo-inositol-hexaphosphate 3-phosphohydrolase